MLKLSIFVVTVVLCGAAPPNYPQNPFERMGMNFGNAFNPLQNFNPFDFVQQFVPQINNINWYKGPNVCNETKSMESEGVEGWPADGGNSNFESESCRGTNEKQICTKSIGWNENARMVMVKYECCRGFVRPQDGSPGCVLASRGEVEEP